jgi:rhamnosyltransferase subunit B
LATILLGWELGEGLGHVQRLLRVGRALAEKGHRPVFALCNVVEPWALLQRDPFPVVQAPYCPFQPRQRDVPFLASGLADVLAVRGWGSVESLYPLVEAWHQLLEYVQPQLIVTDHGPTLCLAAYQSLPVVQVGNWFPLPPVDKPELPLLVPGQPPVMPQEELLAVVQEVQRRRGRAIPPTLTSILAAGDRFPAFFAELDPYRAERTEPIWDPLEPLPAPTGIKPEPRYFAYLTADNPSVEAILTQLALTGCPGAAYVRSAPPELKERLRLQGLTVLDEPAPLSEMLARSAVIVHHGGSTTANSAFAAGRPQIVFPQHLEQAITAQLLSRLGVAVPLLGNPAPDSASRALRQVLGNSEYAERAAAWAQRLHERPPRPALPAILECCQRHL